MIGLVQPPPEELEVDARFLLANERTLLAWTRTALALLAGAVGVFQFGERLAGDIALTIVLVLLGAATAVAGTRRYLEADRAIRAGRLPARGHAPVLVAGAVVLLALGLLVAVVVEVAGP
jgi:putative membrane protein